MAHPFQQKPRRPGQGSAEPKDNQRDVILVPLGRRRLDHLMHEINFREGAHASQDPDHLRFTMASILHRSNAASSVAGRPQSGSIRDTSSAKLSRISSAPLHDISCRLDGRQAGRT